MDAAALVQRACLIDWAIKMILKNVYCVTTGSHFLCVSFTGLVILIWFFPCLGL